MKIVVDMSPPGWVNKERVATWNALVAKAVGDVKKKDYSIVVYVSRGKLHNRGKTLFDALELCGWENPRRIEFRYTPIKNKTIIQCK